MNELIVVFLIFMGAMLRLIIPALRKAAEKVRDGERTPFNWNHRYTLMVLLTTLVGGAGSLVGFLDFVVPVDSSDLVIAISSLVYGFGLDAVLTEIFAWTGFFNTP